MASTKGQTFWNGAETPGHSPDTDMCLAIGQMEDHLRNLNACGAVSWLLPGGLLPGELQRTSVPGVFDTLFWVEPALALFQLGFQRLLKAEDVCSQTGQWTCLAGTVLWETLVHSGPCISRM